MRNQTIHCSFCDQPQDAAIEECKNCGRNLWEFTDSYGSDDEFEPEHRWLRSQGWVITAALPGSERNHVSITYVRNPDSTIVHEYGSSQAYQWEAEWLAEDGWQVISATQQEQAVGCLDILLFGWISLLFKPKARIVVTYRREKQIRRTRKRRL